MEQGRRRRNKDKPREVEAESKLIAEGEEAYDEEEHALAVAEEEEDGLAFDPEAFEQKTSSGSLQTFKEGEPFGGDGGDGGGDGGDEERGGGGGDNGGVGGIGGVCAYVTRRLRRRSGAARQPMKMPPSGPLFRDAGPMLMARPRRPTPGAPARARRRDRGAWRQGAGQSPLPSKCRR